MEKYCCNNNSSLTETKIEECPWMKPAKVYLLVFSSGKTMDNKQKKEVIFKLH